jgi:pimeloyl-ACP methyl ester carboxylesterase
MARLVFVLLALCLLKTEATAAAIPAEFYAQPQTLVSIGTRHLNLYCVGKGGPTVLLDTGLGDTMLVWRMVQSQIADFTRVCAYDRAGYGFSDASPAPSDANSVVDDIHKLILASHMDAPVIYVGHSIAGRYGLLLQAKYPGDVAGEVLLDPSFVGQFNPDGIAASKRTLQKWETCLVLAEKGELKRPKTDIATSCEKSFVELPDGNSQKAMAEPKDIRTAISEMTNHAPPSVGQKSNDDREMEQVKINFHNKPLTVLTRSKFDDPSATPAQVTANRQAWIAGHDELASLSTRGKNIMVPNTDHYIQLDQPEAVVSAIRRVVDEVRQKK